MFSLYKIAISLEDVLSNIKPNQLRGALWNNDGVDPGEIDGDRVLKFKELIKKCIPSDIPENWRGPAAVFVKKVLISIISNGDADDRKQVGFYIVLSPQLIASEIEDFYKFSIAKEDMQAATGKKIGDIASFNSLNDLIFTNRELRPFYEKKVESGGVGYLKSIKQKALDDTSVLIGEPPKGPMVDKNIKIEGMANVDADSFNPSEWSVVVPNSVEAARYWGHGTNWCTSHKDNNYCRFDQYSKEGRLYIFIHKPTGRRYQIHFESNQMMDENDHPIPMKLGNKLHFLIKDIPFVPKFEIDDAQIASSITNIDPILFTSKETFYKKEIEIPGEKDQYNLVSSKARPNGDLEPALVFKKHFLGISEQTKEVFPRTELYWAKDSQNMNPAGARIYKYIPKGLNRSKDYISITNDNAKYKDVNISYDNPKINPSNTISNIGEFAKSITLLNFNFTANGLDYKFKRKGDEDSIYEETGRDEDYDDGATLFNQYTKKRDDVFLSSEYIPTDEIIATEPTGHIIRISDKEKDRINKLFQQAYAIAKQMLIDVQKTHNNFMVPATNKKTASFALFLGWKF